MNRTVHTAPTPKPQPASPKPAVSAEKSSDDSSTDVLGPADLAGFHQEGVASWYGPDFHGKYTSNGEVYDMHKLTAAHQTLPFHTIVEVENMENGRKTRVRINDRGPFLKNRIIDLSFKAAEELGITDSGTARVVLRVAAPVIDGTDGEPVFQVGYFLQLGAFAEQANADVLLQQLRLIAPEITFHLIQEGGLFKVTTQVFAAKEEVESLQERLRRRNIDSFVKERNEGK